MTTRAETLADSIEEHAPRFCSIRRVYPRWIHAEGRTHRVFRMEEGLDIEARTSSLMEDPNLSRNASSSRAIPVERMIADVEANPAQPGYCAIRQRYVEMEDQNNSVMPLSKGQSPLNHAFVRVGAQIASVRVSRAALILDAYALHPISCSLRLGDMYAQSFAKQRRK